MVCALSAHYRLCIREADLAWWREGRESISISIILFVLSLHTLGTVSQLANAQRMTELTVPPSPHSTILKVAEGCSDILIIVSRSFSGSVVRCEKERDKVYKPSLCEVKVKKCREVKVTVSGLVQMKGSGGPSTNGSNFNFALFSLFSQFQWAKRRVANDRRQKGSVFSNWSRRAEHVGSKHGRGGRARPSV